MKSKRTARLIVTALSIGLLAACGTTVSLPPSSSSTSAVDGSGLAGPSLTPADTSSPDGAATTAATAGGSDGTSGVGSASGLPRHNSPTASQSAVAVATTRSTERATKSPVEVGFEVADQQKTGLFLAGVGLNGKVPDQKAFVNALVKDANAHGGIGGHPVVPIFYTLDPTRADPYSVLMQEMCAKWTQDHHVIAAIGNANADWRPVAQCLSRQHAIFTSFGAWIRTRSDYGPAPYWIEPGMISSETLAPAYVSIPDSLGYFGKSARVGILQYDYPQSRQMGAAVTRELSKRGIKVTTTQTLHMGTSTPDLSTTITQAQAAVLRFKALGVDHVMSVAAPGAVFFFMLQAQAQNYFPRYGLTSLEGLIAVTTQAPAAQLANAVAVGFLPLVDTVRAHQPSYNRAAKTCDRMFVAQGLKNAGPTGGFIYCDFMRMLETAALQPAADPRQPDWLLRGAESLGSGFQAAMNFDTYLAPGHRDGVAGMRAMRFSPKCKCFLYVGPTRTMR